jgi:hypothetical protein
MQEVASSKMYYSIYNGMGRFDHSLIDDHYADM